MPPCRCCFARVGVPCNALDHLLGSALFYIDGRYGPFDQIGYVDPVPMNGSLLDPEEGQIGRAHV